MAYIAARIRSIVLKKTVNVDLYFPNDLPEETVPKINGVITLLHGYNNCNTDWFHMTSVCRYAADNGLILVAPFCDNSFYNNMVYGGDYFKYITEELPILLEKMFNIPTTRENNYIAGLSMGGYGAMLIGLSCPDLYAGIGCFSGVVMPDMLMTLGKDLDEIKQAFTPVFGDELKLPEDKNILNLIEKVSKLPENEQPKILLTAGNQDNAVYYVNDQNKLFLSNINKDILSSFKYMEWDGGHEWNFWDRSIVYAIDFFLENGYAEKKHNDWQTQPNVI